MSNEFENTALLMLPTIAKDSPEEKGLLSWSRPFLVNEIRQNGVDVVVSRGAASVDETENAVNSVIRPEYDHKAETAAIERLGTVALNEVAVVRNIIKPFNITTDTPFLNPSHVRSLARDKHHMMRSVLEPADAYHREAVLVNSQTPASELRENVDSLPGTLVVAKPNGGQRSNGVIVGAKSEVLARMQEIPTDTPYIIEEKLQFAQELPGIQGRFSEENERLTHANRAGVNREVRMYYFGNDEWDVVGRVAKVGETDFRSDEWLHLDLESTLNTLGQNASKVMERLRSIVHTDEVNIALDWVYASSASRPEPSWQVMELNAAEPQLVQLGEDLEVGKRQHIKMARQISRIALS